jgi:hypothetical protein
MSNIIFEILPQLIYFGKTITNQNFVQEENERRFNSDNVFCHSVQNLLSFRFMSRNVKIRLHMTIILHFSCGSVWARNLDSNIRGGTWTGTFREEGAEEDIWTE